ncbi:MAG TPA: hypothetical protein VFM55_13900 [Micromonosporaceae bacterium]|nr:hypothetical protein [Micromonosporaceae bacterium]
MGSGTRATAVAFVAVLAAGPLPGVGTSPGPVAYADPPGTARVTFSGEGGLLSCTSAPDRGEVLVPAGSPVAFVNALGEPARLTLGGEPGPVVAAGQAVALEFHRGPVAVRLEPGCTGLLHRSFEAVTVEVTPRPQVTAPAPATVRPDPAPAGGATRPAGEPGRQGAPATTASAVPAHAGSPPSVPVTGDPAGPWARDTAGVAPPPAQGNGLLALVAIFCVAGVLVAAVRTVLARRPR